MSTSPPSLIWEVTARLVLLSDTHIGPAAPVHRRSDEPGTDLPVDRAPDTGLPRLRATTLAGLLRHDLTARTGDEWAARELFGAPAGDPAEDGVPFAEAGRPGGAGQPGALDLDDAQGRVPAHAPLTSRTGNRVDPASGAAVPGHLWRREVLPAGTVFPLHLRLHVSAPAAETRLLTRLVEAVAGLHGNGPGLHVGARTGRGYGVIGATSWAARRHDLTTAPGWFAHYARTWRQRHRDGQEALSDAPPTLVEALTRVLRENGAAETARILPRGHTDRRHRDELRLTLAVGEPDDPLDPERIRPGLLMVADPPPAGRVGTVDRAHRHRPVAHPEDLPTGRRETGARHGLPSGGGPASEGAYGSVRGPEGTQKPERSETGRRAEAAQEAGTGREPEFVRGAGVGRGPEAARGAETGREPETVPAQAPVLGDTALYALLKRIAARLARDACEALGGRGDLWRHWHTHWWGGDTDAATASPRPSRVRLRRTPVLSGGTPLTTTHLTVDALFGDAVDGHLSTSDLHCGGSAEAVLDVYEPDDTVRGLLALLVRELATVPADTLGSGGGSGHGRLTATAATLTTRPGPGRPVRTVDLLAAVRDPESAHARTARAWVARWHARLSPRPVVERHR